MNAPGPTIAAPAADHVLEVNNIEVVYNKVVQVLRGLSLAVPRGQIVALLGSNGAGKSTTLKAVSGLLRTGKRRAATAAASASTASPSPSWRRTSWCAPACAT